MAWRKDPSTGAWKRYRRTYNKETQQWDYKEIKGRRKYTTTDSVTIQVRCSGHLHTISFTPHKTVPGRKIRHGGRLTLHHHDIHEDLPLEKAMVRLGQGKLSRCFHVFDAFVDLQKRTGRYGSAYVSRRRLPPELQYLLQDVIIPALRHRENIKWRRSQKMINPDLLAMPLSERLPYIVSMAAKTALRLTRYFSLVKRNPETDDYETIVVRDDEYGSIHGYANSWRGGISLKAKIHLSRWWKLRRIGAALVEGLFIADLAHEKLQEKYPVGENELLVIAGKPIQNDMVTDGLAVIQLEGAEWKLVRWVP